MSVATPPGGRTVPGGITPPGGEAPPGGRGAPGDKSAPTAPLGRPPRITLRPLKRRGRTTKTVQKIKPSPPTPAQRVRNVLNAQQQRQQHRQQIHTHVKSTMPHIQQANQPGPGPQVPPQSEGMGLKGKAHKEETKAKVDARLGELRRAPVTRPLGETYYKDVGFYQQSSLAESKKELAQDSPDFGKGLSDPPNYGINPPIEEGEKPSAYNERFADYGTKYNAMLKAKRPAPEPIKKAGNTP